LRMQAENREKIDVGNFIILKMDFLSHFENNAENKAENGF